VPARAASRTRPADSHEADSHEVDSHEIAGQLRLSVTRLARILRHQDASGLSATLTSALAAVARGGPLTLGDLAAREHVTPPTATRVIDKLEAKGLVQRAADTRDGRVVLVALTAAGEEWLAEARSRRTAWLVERLHDLPESDLRCLADASRILAQLTEAGGSGATL
jgi:DNA-binding MarR family transcriptional regulator